MQCFSQLSKRHPGHQQGKVSLLALGVAAVIAVMFVYGKQQSEPTAQDLAQAEHMVIAQRNSAQPAAPSIVANPNYAQEMNRPVVDEVVVTAKRIESTPVAFDVPPPSVALRAPELPKSFWSQS